METSALTVVGTVTFVVGVALCGLVMEIVNRARLNQTTVAEAKRITREAEHKEREERRKRDQQLNHGRRVYNWLKEELAVFKQDGVRVLPIEENGSRFSIQVVQMHADGSGFYDHLVQVDFDFVHCQEPYGGHIHYGACGADLLFWVDRHGQAWNHGLHELVVNKVKRYLGKVQ